MTILERVIIIIAIGISTMAFLAAYISGFID